MPVLLDESVVGFEFLDLAHRQPVARPTKPLSRREGVHLSGILKYIAERTGKLKQGEPLEEEMPTLIALGFAWEEFCVSLYPDIIWQPGEREVEGVAMNADGLSVIDINPSCSNTAIQIEEFKLTFKSVFSGADFLKDPRHWLWLMQGRGYCYGYGALTERWHVCHVRGDYKSFGPVYKTYTVRFSERELEQSWKMIINYRGKAVAERAAHS